MSILLIIALILAWPTYGLSLLAWLVLLHFSSKRKLKGIDRMRENQPLIDSLFRKQHAEFVRTLDLPYLSGLRLSEADANQCARHLINYLAHNPDEAALFIKGLEKWKPLNSTQLSDPVTAARSEKQYNAKGEIHLTSYRAIEALMTNNKGLKCFELIDLGKLMQERILLDTRLTMLSPGSRHD